MDTKGFGGKKVKKTIKVTSNDPLNKRFNLVITGQVKQFAKISPSRVRLSGKPDDLLERTVKISPLSEYPFEIVSVKTQKNKNIKTDLKEVKGEGVLEYELTITNIQKNQGSYHDSVILKTSSKVKPEITIKVSGYIMPKPTKPKS